MRDYATLIEAVSGTDIPCHIATSHVRHNRLIKARHIPASELAKNVSPNVTIGPKPLIELRDLYHRAAFVVSPLLHTDTDNGMTAILEAMAMGKAVICSRTRGQVDVIQEGVTGIFVPVGDSAALRTAILELWRNPERARRMGEAGRAYVQKHHALEKFCGDVKQGIETLLSAN
jgi:glycosyltransferase involved in cell wall biosynthesis